MKLKYIALLSIFFSMQAAVEQGRVDSDGCIIFTKNQWLGGLLDWYNCKIIELRIHDENFLPIKIHGEIWGGPLGRRNAIYKFNWSITYVDHLKFILNILEFSKSCNGEAIIANFLKPFFLKIVEKWKVERKKIFPVIVARFNQIRGYQSYEIFMSLEDEKKIIDALRIKHEQYYDFDGSKEWFDIMKIVDTQIETKRKAGWKI